MKSIKKTIIVDDTPDMAASEMTRSDGTPILVEAARRDSEGNIIASTYARKTEAQPPLHSGYNIKTINGVSILGSGDISIDLGISRSDLERLADELSSGFESVDDALNELKTQLTEELESGLESIDGAISEMSGRIDANGIDIDKAKKEIAEIKEALANAGQIVVGYMHNDGMYSDSAHTNRISGRQNDIYIDLGDDTGTLYRYVNDEFIAVGSSSASGSCRISYITLNGESAPVSSKTVSFYFSAGTKSTYSQGAFDPGTQSEFVQGKDAYTPSALTDSTSNEALVLTFDEGSFTQGVDKFTPGKLPSHGLDIFNAGALPSLGFTATAGSLLDGGSSSSSSGGQTSSGEADAGSDSSDSDSPSDESSKQASNIFTVSCGTEDSGIFMTSSDGSSTFDATADIDDGTFVVTSDSGSNAEADDSPSANSMAYNADGTFTVSSTNGMTFETGYVVSDAPTTLTTTTISPDGTITVTSTPVSNSFTIYQTTL